MSFEKLQMDGTLFLAPAFINRSSHMNTLIDCRSKSYGLIDAHVANRPQLPLSQCNNAARSPLTPLLPPAYSGMHSLL
jgi:hypothetical protein